jgi:hypothetical protein
MGSRGCTAAADSPELHPHCTLGGVIIIGAAGR